LENITIVNIYAPNIAEINFMKQTILNIKAQIDPNAIKMGNSNAPLLSIDRSSRQKKINNKTSELNDIKGQIDLTDMYRIFYQKTEEYIYILAVDGAFFKTDHILGQKVSLNKDKKTETPSCIL
jgi:hypothetical protein